MMRRQRPTDEPTALVNSLLDHIRTTRQLTSDEALAHELGVSDTAIYRWRIGQIDKVARILLPLAIEHADALAS